MMEAYSQQWVLRGEWKEEEKETKWCTGLGTGGGMTKDTVNYGKCSKGSIKVSWAGKV